MTYPFTITETIKVHPVKFAFTSFKDIAVNLKEALQSGTLRRGKRYEITIKEI